MDQRSAQGNPITVKLFPSHSRDSFIFPMKDKKLLHLKFHINIFLSFFFGGDEIVEGRENRESRNRCSVLPINGRDLPRRGYSLQGQLEGRASSRNSQ